MWDELRQQTVSAADATVVAELTMRELPAMSTWS